MKLRELLDHLHALPDDPDSEVFVQMLPADGGQARPEDQSGSVVQVRSGDHTDPFGVNLGVILEAVHTEIGD